MFNTCITFSKYELEGVKPTCEMLDNYFACVFKRYTQRTMDLIKSASSDDACVLV